jgi:hypothetical protein
MGRLCTLALLGGLAACGSPAREEPTPIMGPDCAALRQAARRAAACDPALADLAEAMADDHDEPRCSRAARRLLAAPETQTPRIHSLFEPVEHERAAPLSEAERGALLSLSIPAEVLIVPDLPRAPGLPLTSADLEDVPLDADERGRLHGYVAAGTHTLRLRHAGEETTYCVDLDPCDRLAITAHGAKLAAHPRVRVGACGTSASAPTGTVARARERL